MKALKTELHKQWIKSRSNRYENMISRWKEHQPHARVYCAKCIHFFILWQREGERGVEKQHHRRLRACCHISIHKFDCVISKRSSKLRVRLTIAKHYVCTSKMAHFIGVWVCDEEREIWSEGTSIQTPTFDLAMCVCVCQCCSLFQLLAVELIFNSMRTIFVCIIVTE